MPCKQLAFACWLPPPPSVFSVASFTTTHADAASGPPETAQASLSWLLQSDVKPTLMPCHPYTHAPMLFSPAYSDMAYGALINHQQEEELTCR